MKIKKEELQAKISDKSESYLTVPLCRRNMVFAGDQNGSSSSSPISSNWGCGTFA
jgi:hypothetical protein